MAGFDWVFFESNDYVRLSVIPDSELGAKGWSERGEEGGRKGRKEEGGGRDVKM